jgi:hypothetical protein
VTQTVALRLRDGKPSDASAVTQHRAVLDRHSVMAVDNGNE